MTRGVFTCRGLPFTQVINTDDIISYVCLTFFLFVAYTCIHYYREHAHTPRFQCTALKRVYFMTWNLAKFAVYSLGHVTHPP